MEHTLPKAVLYCQNGKSDKEYRIEINAEGDAYRVRYAFGRRDSSLKEGVKTETPVSLETAKAIFEKLLQEKVAKGYAIAEISALKTVKLDDGKHEAWKGGFLPQLLNAIDANEVPAIINDPAYGMQEKMDGERRSAVILQEGEVIGLNRRAMMVRLPVTVSTELSSMYRQFAPCIVDGEMIGEMFYLFDIIRYENDDFDLPVNETVAQRYLNLAGYFCEKSQSVKIVTLFSDSADKEKLYQKCRQDGREGVVFKKLTAVFTPGRPNSGGDWLKFKFVATASCVVLGVNRQRSVAVGMCDSNGAMVNVGNVTIPPNHRVPSVAAIVEVRYLYAFKNGCLFQPVYLGERFDVEPDVIDQLKWKMQKSVIGW